MKNLFALVPALLLFPMALLAQEKEIKVEVNKNIEAISTLANFHYPSMLRDSLADPWMYRNTRLMRLNHTYFRPHGRHPAVAATKAMMDRIGTGVYLLGLYYHDLPAAERKHPLPNVILQELHPDRDSAVAIADNYIREVARFYSEAHFDEFLSEQETVYALAKAEVRRNLPDKSFIPMLEAYYGQEKNGYHIVVMPFFKSLWGMGWEIDNEGKKDIYNIAAPFNEQRVHGGKVTEAGYDNFEELRNLSVHEYGHSFANTTRQGRLAEQVNRYRHLYKPVAGMPQYTDWETVFNEHLVRAGEIRILTRMGRRRESAQLRESYKDWPYLGHFIEQLKFYEKNRRSYPNIESFLPVLIDSLSEIHKK